MRRMTPQQLGLVILSVSEVPNFLAGVLPSLFTIRTFSDDPEKVKALRHGELVGGAMSLAVGAGASLVSQSAVPFVACAATLGIFLWQYENAIRNPIDDPATGRPLDMKAAVNGHKPVSGGRPR
jgi:hypothetical protein